MVTVAEAAEALGIDARTVREKLSTDEWKGEKRLIGMKEKWFMHRGELDRQLERLKIMRPQTRVSTQVMDEVFTGEEAIEATTVDSHTIEGKTIEVNDQFSKEQIKTLVAGMTEQFSKQLKAEQEVIFTLKKDLDEKDRQLRLLPDLQKRAEDEHKAAELKELEAVALRKQIEALQQDQEVSQKAKQQVLELEQALIESKQQAEEELQRIKNENQAEADLVKEQLKAINATMAELKQPWWKKMFSSPQS
jgi:hypothetical protein